MPRRRSWANPLPAIGDRHLELLPIHELNHPIKGGSMGLTSMFPNVKRLNVLVLGRRVKSIRPLNQRYIKKIVTFISTFDRRL